MLTLNRGGSSEDQIVEELKMGPTEEDSELYREKKVLAKTAFSD